jgi:hypothetical protein
MPERDGQDPAAFEFDVEPMPTDDQLSPEGSPAAPTQSRQEESKVVVDPPRPRERTAPPGPTETANAAPEDVPPAGSDDGIQPVPADLTGCVRNLPARDCQICNRRYYPGYPQQRYCWTCKKQITEKKSTKEDESAVTDDVKSFVARVTASDVEIPPVGELLSDEWTKREKITFSGYGEISCTKQERLAAQLLAADERVSCVAAICSLPKWKVMDLQDGAAPECRKFPDLVGYYSGRHQFLAFSAMSRTLGELSAKAKKDGDHKLAGDLLMKKAEVDQSKMKLLPAPAVSRRDRMGSLSDLIPPSMTTTDFVVRNLQRVLRYQKGGLPRVSKMPDGSNGNSGT